MTALVLAMWAAVATADAPPAVDPRVDALKNASVPELIARGKASITALGDYRVKSTIEERIGGKMRAPYTVQMWVRESPFAVRMEYLTGPSQGRRAFYDAQARPGDLRVRESGILSIAGSLWIDIHSSLLFKETNHGVNDLGLGAVLRIQQAGWDKAQAFGGLIRTDEGLNERGRYCIRYDAPPGAKGLYAQKSLLCLDPDTAIPLEVTDWDEKGLLERFMFQGVEPHAAEGAGVFTAKAAGL
jgi:hypothetical protein